MGLWSNVYTYMLMVDGVKVEREMVARAEAEAYIGGVGDFALSTVGHRVRKELERLRAIEAAAQELGAHAPVAILVMTDEWSCCYCGGVIPFTVDAREPEHNPGCKWVALQAALGKAGGE
jgi:hypothetical protein